MAKYPNTIATLSGVGNRTIFGTTLVKSWVTEIIAIQSDYNNVRGSASNLVTFLNTARNKDGTLKTFQVSHGALKGVTASQHHTKIHGTRHQASDLIRLSHIGTTFQTGLMTTTQYKRVESWSSNANIMLGTTGVLNGNGAAGQTYNLGWIPDFVECVFSNGAFTAWRASTMGALRTDKIHHASVNATPTKSHKFTSGVTAVTIEANGFQIWSNWNSVGHDGYYFATKRPS